MIPHGIHANITNAEYHAKELGMVSKTALDLVERSPAHYKAWIDGGEEAPTDALRFGSTFHCALLEMARFQDSHYVVPKFGDCRKKENKAARDAWRTANGWVDDDVGIPGKTQISDEEFSDIEGMVLSVVGHPLAGKMLADGEPELTVRWRDAHTGLECKARPDYYVRKRRMVVDVKSTFDASFDGFKKSIANYNYHVQAALYRDGLEACGERVEHFLFVAVEKKPPYALAVYTLDAQAAAKGYDIARTGIEKLAECMRTGEWPSYPATIQTINLPAWAA
jgi:hypothetical protein